MWHRAIAALLGWLTSSPQRPPQLARAKVSQPKRLGRLAWFIGSASVFQATVGMAAGFVVPPALDRALAAIPITSAPPAHSEHPPVIAAGFGYQAKGTSTILVKTYNPVTGDVLTEDSYELSVREEGTTPDQKEQGRIFAGGVGIDGQGLSAFMLRVYEATTGKFLWEGQLNLVPAGEGGEGKLTAGVLPSPPRARAIVEKKAAAMPHYAVRAFNAETGALVWSDEFGTGKAKPSSDRSAGTKPKSEAPDAQPIFNFTVRTVDGETGKVLWQDTFEPVGVVELPAIEEEERAMTIPSWPLRYQLPMPGPREVRLLPSFLHS
jgi:hypothetical protein